MSESPARTPLHDWHARHGGRMVDFAGWSMPVQYTSIVEEHVATRQACGLFDISHMGRLQFTGPDAAAFLERFVTRSVLKLKPGMIRYGLMTNEAGGILDDVLVYNLTAPDEGAAPDFWLVVNASNRAKIVDWIRQHQGDADGVQWHDRTSETAMIAVQGPAALAGAAPLVQDDPANLKYYRGTWTTVQGNRGIVSRTGYTGEDGCELIVPATAAVAVWEQLLESAGRVDTGEIGVRPAGLGARDTLRLEAAMPLYGHELDEETNPFDAGLDFAVQLEGRDFLGRDALVHASAEPRSVTRIGLALDGKRVPREDYPVLDGDRQVGRVTSGTFSPTLQHPIAMAYVAPEAAVEGRQLNVAIRQRYEPARVVPLPFYRRST